MKPAKRDSRICFGIEYYLTEEEAIERGKEVRKRGDTYNGGLLDGAPCGRDTQWDYEDPELGMLYAVTVA